MGSAPSANFSRGMSRGVIANPGVHNRLSGNWNKGNWNKGKWPGKPGNYAWNHRHHHRGWGGWGWGFAAAPFVYGAYEGSGPYCYDPYGNPVWNYYVCEQYGWW
jgi:hypothetical protein